MREHLMNVVKPDLPTSGNIVVLTGAGISAESGLSTFRDKDGLWSQVQIEDVATPEAFARQPHVVQDFYNKRRAQLSDEAIQPNKAHHALARLEKTWQELGRGTFTLITQNVDDLHERAGSRNVLHMHGQLARARCLNCHAVVPWLADLHSGSNGTACPQCAVKGQMRPHIVWFGEVPFFLDEIGEKLSECALFVSVGTSGQVQPAGQFAAEARLKGGAYTVELNLEGTGGPFDLARQGEATIRVPEFVDELIGAMS